MAQNIRALGRLVVAFQNLEFILLKLVWSLISPDAGIGSRITRGLSYRQLVELFESLFAYRAARTPGTPGDAMADLKTIVSRARQLEELRNVCVHSYWLTRQDGQIMRMKYTKNPGTASVELAGGDADPAGVHQNADAVEELRRELMKWQGTQPAFHALSMDEVYAAETRKT